MRKALNENPLVQAAAVGVLVLVAGALLLLRMGGSAEEAPATATTTAAATTDPAATAPPATDPASSSAVPTATVEGTTASGFTAGPGLPAPVVDAYDKGQAVALLIVNERAIDDRKLEATVKSLGERPDVTLFVTDVRDVPDYSRITEGVNLQRTPALVVIRPKSLTEGPVPTAVVSYGFRGGRSVEQALDDALYKGPDDLPYYP